MRRLQDLHTSFNILLLVSILAVAAMAADKTKSYRLVVDSPFQVAGKILEPGNYNVRVVLGDNQKAQVSILLKDQMLVQFGAKLEPLPETNQEDGVRMILPDGKTRVLQKIWFQGTKYLLLPENNSSGATIASR